MNFRRGIEPDSGIRGKRMSELNYGDSVEHLLYELSQHYEDEIKGSFEIRGEDENGVEGYEYIEVSLLADDAMKLIAELKAQRDALAAENAALTSSLKALATLNNRLWQWTSRMSYNASYVGEPEGLVKGHIREMEKILDVAAKETPATEVFLNSVRAEGADKVAEYHFVRIDALKEVSRQGHLFHKAAYSDAFNVANIFRAGKDGE